MTDFCFLFRQFYLRSEIHINKSLSIFKDKCNHNTHKYAILQDIYHIIGMEQDTSYMLLKSLDTPEDLRRLEADKLPEVCKELRQK